MIISVSSFLDMGLLESYCFLYRLTDFAFVSNHASLTIYRPSIRLFNCKKKPQPGSWHFICSSLFLQLTCFSYSESYFLNLKSRSSRLRLIGHWGLKYLKTYLCTVLFSISRSNFIHFFGFAMIYTPSITFSLQ